jgi:hypothetical protein
MRLLQESREGYHPAHLFAPSQEFLAISLGASSLILRVSLTRKRRFAESSRSRRRGLSDALEIGENLYYFCTGVHSFSQRSVQILLAKKKREGYSPPRLSREALKTLRHN